MSATQPLNLEQPVPPAADADLARARAVARRQAPAVRAVALEALGIADRVLALHQRRAPAVLEVVDAVAAHEGVLDAAQVDPHVRVLVDEQRAGRQVRMAVDPAPAVAPQPRVVGPARSRVRALPQRKAHHQQRLAVASPVVGQEAALGTPAVAEALAAVLHPAPVDAVGEAPGGLADLALAQRGAVEVARGGLHAGDQEGGVDAGELAVPGPGARVHVEEVEVEAAVAGGVPRARHVRVAEEAQRGQHERDRALARHPAALDGDRVGRQRQAHRRDAAGAVRLRRVEDEAAGRIGRLLEVAEGVALRAVDERVDVDVRIVHGAVPRAPRFVGRAGRAVRAHGGDRPASGRLHPDAGLRGDGPARARAGGLPVARLLGPRALTGATARGRSPGRAGRRASVPAARRPRA